MLQEELCLTRSLSLQCLAQEVLNKHLWKEEKKVSGKIPKGGGKKGNFPKQGRKAVSPETSMVA